MSDCRPCRRETLRQRADGERERARESQTENERERLRDNEKETARERERDRDKQKNTTDKDLPNCLHGWTPRLEDVIKCTLQRHRRSFFRKCSAR